MKQSIFHTWLLVAAFGMIFGFLSSTASARVSRPVVIVVIPPPTPQPVVSS